MRSFEDLNAKLKEVQAHYENLAVGFGGGAVGSVASFTLEQPLNGVATVQATCLTPCPPGRSQLFKDANGSWYAISPNTAVLQSIEVTQNRRRTVQEEPKPVRLAMVLLEITTESGNIFAEVDDLSPSIYTYSVIVDGKLFQGIISQRQRDLSYDNLGHVPRESQLQQPYLSADASGTISFDTWKYEYDLQHDSSRRVNYHFKIQGSTVTQVDRSSSWRKEWVNTTGRDAASFGSANPIAPNQYQDIGDYKVDPNPFINHLRIRNTYNLQNGKVWRVPTFPQPSGAPSQILSGGYTLPDVAGGEVDYLIHHSIRGRLEIANLVGIYDPYGYGQIYDYDGRIVEVREFKTARLRFEFPANTVLSIQGLIAY